MAPRREAHRGGPSQIPVAAEYQYAHEAGRVAESEAATTLAFSLQPFAYPHAALLTAGLFPPELTALRAVGLILGVALIAYAVVRRRALRNVDVAASCSSPASAWRSSPGTEITDELLSAFSFEKGNGGRILGLAVFAIFILFLLILRALSAGGAQRAPALGRCSRGSPGRSSARRDCRSASGTRSRS